MNKSEYLIKKISAIETYPVRHPILRAGRPIGDCAFELDNKDSTFHLGLFYKNELIGVASFMENNNPNFNDKTQYQLRGMAILKTHQKKGLGKLLLEAGENEIAIKCSRLWFNAREIAITFYKNCGYNIIGEPFNIVGIGKHYIMTKILTRKKRL